MCGSIALVGSGEFLPTMADFEKSLINDGIENGKRPIYVQIPTAAGQKTPDRLKYWEEHRLRFRHQIFCMRNEAERGLWKAESAQH